MDVPVLVVSRSDLFCRVLTIAAAVASGGSHSEGGHDGAAHSCVR